MPPQTMPPAIVRPVGPGLATLLVNPGPETAK